MRLLAQADQMTPEHRLKAESFAKWLLTVGEGKDNTVPFTQLPIGIPIVIIFINHCNRLMHA
jgi:hypothetical protein